MSTELYTRVVSSLLFPMHERLKGHDTTAIRRLMETTQWYAGERMDMEEAVGMLWAASGASLQ